MFRDDAELASMLHHHCRHPSSYPSADEIRQDVHRRYGLVSFGRALLAELAVFGVVA